MLMVSLWFFEVSTLIHSDKNANNQHIEEILKLPRNCL